MFSFKTYMTSEQFDVVACTNTAVRELAAKISIISVM